MTRIRAKANGDVIDATDEAAQELLAAGIYEAVEEPPPENAPAIRPKRAKG